MINNFNPLNAADVTLNLLMKIKEANLANKIVKVSFKVSLDTYSADIDYLQFEYGCQLRIGDYRHENYRHENYRIKATDMDEIDINSLLYLHKQTVKRLIESIRSKY